MHRDNLWARRGLVLAIAALTLAWQAAAAAEPAAADPVEALRQALRQDRDAVGTRDALGFRDKTLTKYAERVRTLSDLGHALMLREWRYENLDPNVSGVDQKVWRELAERFVKQAKDAVESSSPEEARPAVTVIAEMATMAQTDGIRPGDLEERLASLTPSLAKLTESSDPELRTTAVRALGTLGPKAKDALKALEHTLKTDGVPQRRAAAQALINLIRLAAQGEREGTIYQGAGGLVPPVGGAATPPGLGRPGPMNQAVIETHNVRLIDMSKEILPVATVALADADAEVRRRGAEAVRQAALNFLDSILLPVSLDFPPPDRPLTQDESQRIKDYRAEVGHERQLLEPLAQALTDQVPALGKAVDDDNLRVSSAAGEALESLAAGRRKLARRVSTLPVLPGEDAVPRRTDPLGERLKAAVPSLAKRLSTAQEPGARLVPLYALEALEADAAPAAPQVVKALDDKDPFVRWAAVRALGVMGLKGEPAEKAVAGLAPRLTDDSGDVRTSAAVALQRYGPAAAGAAAALAAVVKGDDPEMRLLAVLALEAVGPPAGKEAGAALVQALKADESLVRAAAARALGHVGPLDRSAREALRTALDDPDGEVRRAAAASLLRAGQDKDKPDSPPRPKRPGASP
jgi:HEAT repeat protein